MHVLTERNISSTDEGEVIARYLWRSWSRFWDTSVPVLVEKSPTNILKVRWLAQAMGPFSVSLRFLFAVKDPVANSRFKRPRACANYTRCDGGRAPALRLRNSELLS